MVGSSLGPYSILEPLGAGGMGEVYLAEDTRLGRKVAIKVLPEDFAENAERRTRFEQEARAAAALNHPHIAVVHDIGNQAGTHFIVQEHLQGQTLRELLEKGGLPLKRALELGLEVVEALKAAHRAGIVHRDLKPENVFITEDGHAKVLDFGLAKLTEVETAPQAGISMSPTVLGTQTGAIMGTAGYMAPEQVQGEDVDARADLFAFGCLLYEMSTGRQPFAGKNVYDTIGKIVSDEPEPVERVVADLPRELGRIVRKCLAKDRERRCQSAADALVDLQMLAADMESGSSASTATSSAGASAAVADGSRAISWKLAVPGALFTLVLGVAAGRLLAPAPEPGRPQVARLQLQLPDSTSLPRGVGHTLAIAPDGSKIAFVGSTGGGQQLFVRQLDRFETASMPGTFGAREPVFSPDGEWIAFQADGALKRIAVAGGDPFTLCTPCGAGRWGEDGRIYTTSGGALMSLPEVGGDPQVVLEPSHDGEPLAMSRATVLPGGGVVLFEGGSGGRQGVYAARLDTGEVLLISDDATDPRWALSGHILMPRGATLFAVPFEPGRFEVQGPPVPVLENVRVEGGGALQVAVSATGTLVYASSVAAGTRLVWVERSGEERAAVVEARAFSAPRISPDGASIAVGAGEAGSNDIWIYDIVAGTSRPLTTSGGAVYPLWTPDGARVAYSEGGTTLLWQPADGSAGPEVLVETADVSFSAPETWAPDGRRLVYRSVRDGNADLRVTAVDGDASALLETPEFSETAAALSHDGRWLAYVSNRSGAREVYVRPFPGPGGETIVSIGGGSEPLWAPDDRTLYYKGPASLVAVSVETDPDFRIQGREELFSTAPYRSPSSTRAHYDLHPDDERFLMIRAPVTSEGRPHLNVALNWFQELTRRAPAAR